jgi:hypothetical protein
MNHQRTVNDFLRSQPLGGQKKRGSLSRVKSTPKEEGGGDKSEPETYRY